MYLNPAIISEWMSVREAEVQRRSARFQPLAWFRSSSVRPARAASGEWARRARFRRQRSPSAAC
jgi:hypothetical protein